LLLLSAGEVTAGKADVLDAKARCRPAPGNRPASICQFTVTIKHADAGWDHYANRYEIVAPGGDVLSTRVLRHPHVDEQPFTRSQSRVRIPHETTSVEVRAGDLVHGLGGTTVEVVVPHAKKPASEPPAS
jgi:hypothetical protein